MCNATPVTEQERKMESILVDQKTQISLWLKKDSVLVPFRLWNWSNSIKEWIIIPVSTERLGKVHSPGQTVRGAGMKMGSLLRGRAALLPPFAHGPQAHLAFVEICGQM